MWVTFIEGSNITKQMALLHPSSKMRVLQCFMVRPVQERNYCRSNGTVYFLYKNRQCKWRIHFRWMVLEVAGSKNANVTWLIGNYMERSLRCLHVFILTLLPDCVIARCVGRMIRVIKSTTFIWGSKCHSWCPWSCIEVMFVKFRLCALLSFTLSIRKECFIQCCISN